MRIWSLHPKYLDPRGLVALWREALLAQAVLGGRTKGYSGHPQLKRFRAQPSPLGAIADYLRGIHAEAVRRRYAFDARKIGSTRGSGVIPVSRGQLLYEWGHLLAKLAIRDPELRHRVIHESFPEPHPLFRVVPGGIEPWERPRMAAARRPHAADGAARRR